ncbi:trace amine-associated receptor 7g-like [Paramacrobiotus metropolitanus]|uniref:trace amine-associated receptor 7g-like n=1 Tax=Paramacrobiotus metropolitanus TaxID=2943436 RepID=UPI0024459452|nr:trace amine-associated receptor 7g-like [Paramacrobiotus metropolitanus]
MDFAVATNYTAVNWSAAHAPWIVYHTELLIWYYTMVTLSVLGTVFCLLVLTGILSSRKLRFGSGALIANLLVSLLLQCALFVPLVTISTAGIPLGVNTLTHASRSFCRHSFVGYFILNKVVSMADMMIGINRFVAICFPHHYPRWTTRPALAVMIGIPWLLSLIFGFAIYFQVGGVFQASPPWGACAVTFASDASSWLSLLMGVLLPIGTLGLLFSIIFMRRS